MQWLIDIVVERVLLELETNGATLASLHLKGNTTVDLNETHDIGTQALHHKNVFARVLRAEFYYNLSGTMGLQFGADFYYFLLATKDRLRIRAPLPFPASARAGLVINNDQEDSDTRICSTTSLYAINLDAANSRTGINTNAPAKDLDVNGDISIQAGGGDYYSNDGSQGFTGTFTEHTGKTVTVKNGIITNVV